MAVAANRGLQRNCHLTGFNELLPSQAAQAVVDWLKDGVPLDLVCRVVEQKCAEYRPGPKGRQPTGFRYFDGAIREAHDKAVGQSQMAAASTQIFREAE